jgi:RNA ligase (TIGR02306 family)
MTERKLVTVQEIKDVFPIEGADNIERANVLNWQVVVQKGQFKPGDKCIYFEYDSVLPEKPEFEFLRKSSFIDKNGFKGFLLKTKKLRGIISQGLVIPVDENMKELPVGTEVTDLLGVVKYDPPLPAHLQGLVKGSFPSFIPKTDELRIQGTNGVLERNRGKVFYVTEKIDGTSVTYYLKGGEFGVCSRTLELKESPGNTYWEIARNLKIEEGLRSLCKNIAIQGEIYGFGVGRKYGMNCRDFMMYSVYDLDTNRYLGFNDMRFIASSLGLKKVPIINSAIILNHSLEELLEMATFQSTLNDKFRAEGIVMRSVEEDTDPELGRLSFKVLNNTDLEKQKV